jgi:hypothetical protein
MSVESPPKGPGQAGRDFENAQEAQRRKGRRLERKRGQIKKRLDRLRSRKPTLRVTRDANADDRLFRAIRASINEGERVHITGTTGEPVEDFRHQKNRKKIPKAKNQGLVSRSYWCPLWNNTTDKLKALSWAMVMYDKSAFSMSINLGDDVIDDLRSKGPGFARHLGERIRRHLRRHLSRVDRPVPEFFISVEASYGIKPHVHGGIIIEPVDDLVAQAAVRRALEAAGGDWEPKRNRVHLTRMYTPLRWIAYVTKWEIGTRLHLGDKSVVAVSSGLRGAAREWYEEARATGRRIA